MRFIGTAKMSTNAFSQKLRGKQPIGFHHSAIAMDPLGFNRVEPGTFGGQETRQDADAFAFSFDLGVVCADPSAHELAHMPGGVVPNEQPGPFPFSLHLVTPPLHTLLGYLATAPPRD